MSDKIIPTIPINIYEGESSFDKRIDFEIDPRWDYHIFVSQDYIDKYNKIMETYTELMIELDNLKKNIKEPTREE